MDRDVAASFRQKRACVAAVLLAMGWPGAAHAQDYVFGLSEDSSVVEWIVKTAGQDENRIKEWPPLAYDDAGVVYAKIKEVRQDTLTTVKMWARKDYYLDFEYQGKTGRSEVIYYEVDCAQDLMLREKSASYYKKLGGQGERIAHGRKDWRYAEAGSADYLVAKFACTFWKPRGSTDWMAPGIR